MKEPKFKFGQQVWYYYLRQDLVLDVDYRTISSINLVDNVFYYPAIEEALLFSTKQEAILGAIQSLELKIVKLKEMLSER